MSRPYVKCPECGTCQHPGTLLCLTWRCRRVFEYAVPEDIQEERAVAVKIQQAAPGVGTQLHHAGRSKWQHAKNMEKHQRFWHEEPTADKPKRGFTYRLQCATNGWSFSYNTSHYHDWSEHLIANPEAEEPPESFRLTVDELAADQARRAVGYQEAYEKKQLRKTCNEIVESACAATGEDAL